MSEAQLKFTKRLYTAMLTAFVALTLFNVYAGNFGLAAIDAALTVFAAINLAKLKQAQK